MSDLRIVRDYPHPPAKVWRVLTEPPLMALLGMRPEGYAPVVGTKFRLVGKPNPGWRGFVECEVLEAREPSVLVYRWDDDGKNPPTQVRYTLEPHAGGTRLTVEHTGLQGRQRVPLHAARHGAGLEEDARDVPPCRPRGPRRGGTLRPGSTLKPRF